MVSVILKIVGVALYREQQVLLCLMSSRSLLTLLSSSQISPSNTTITANKGQTISPPLNERHLHSKVNSATLWL